jgi:NAD(P)-dependent dehydrogenase (short-subunit alcohol dehydrogenase family)
MPERSPNHTRQAAQTTDLLTGSRVVVVGAGSGFGLATALGAAEAGADVVVISHSAASVERALELLPSSVTGHAVSALDAVKLRRVFDDIGTFDHLVYTAADRPVAGTITTMPIGDVRKAFEIRYFGALTTIGCAVQHVRRSITLTSGAASIRPRRTSGVLASVCGAMEGLGRALAVELAPVRVNVVRPGFTNTGMWSDLDADARAALFKQTADTNLVGHVGEAAEVARAYLHCMTSSYATGSIVTVDGGYALV